MISVYINNNNTISQDAKKGILISADKARTSHPMERQKK